MKNSILWNISEDSTQLLGRLLHEKTYIKILVETSEGKISR
jgi:hypothetical protein